MTLRQQLVGAMVAMAGALLAAEPVVSNIQARQLADRSVEITYDLTADGAVSVLLELSADGGAHFAVPAETLSGDVGAGVSAGTGKRIVWDAVADWEGELTEQMVARLSVSDRQGCPSLAWGNEVKAGGLLLGQDGGAEGSGPSCHVNIPYSFWLAKTEVTRAQFCQMLNHAQLAGYLRREGHSKLYTTAAAAEVGLAADKLLCNLGDNNLRWNVTRFDVAAGQAELPAVVTWYGAFLFCRFYGYDLPTYAEWEKAARGPDHDDAAEHLLYPWGDTFYTTLANANTDVVAVGQYPANDYALHDMIGNAAEWTRTLGADFDLEAYPACEDVETESIHETSGDGTRLLRGIGSRGTYAAQASLPYNAFSGGTAFSFRPIRRATDNPADFYFYLNAAQLRDAVYTTSRATDREITASFYGLVPATNSINSATDAASITFSSNIQDPISAVKLKLKNRAVTEGTVTLEAAYTNRHSTTSRLYQYDLTLPAEMDSFHTYTLPLDPADDQECTLRLLFKNENISLANLAINDGGHVYADYGTFEDWHLGTYGHPTNYGTLTTPTTVIVNHKTWKISGAEVVDGEGVDGSRCLKIISNTDYVSNPFSLTFNTPNTTPKRIDILASVRFNTTNYRHEIRFQNENREEYSNSYSVDDTDYKVAGATFPDHLGKLTIYIPVVPPRNNTGEAIYLDNIVLRIYD
ncbi:MAG: formylglycine-generating enzyme family protein [Candidatus Spyradenecus sp.]